MRMQQPERTGRGHALALALVGVAATAALADAQTVSSFDQLRQALSRGDRITVTDHTGQDLTGRIVYLSASTLSLVARDGRHDLRDADVSQIRQRRPDSLRNGTLIGLGVGAIPAGLFARFAYAYTHNEGGRAQPGAGLGVALFLGVGAWVGSELDKRIQRSHVIYGSTRGAGRVTVSPLLSRDRRGVAVSLGF